MQAQIRGFSKEKELYNFPEVGLAYRGPVRYN
jgi:hypothetical protein